MSTTADICQRQQPPSILKETILKLYERVVNLSTLEPVQETNHVFSALVELCSAPYSEADLAILSDAKIQQLRPDLISRCSEAEYHLERHYARKSLIHFPYYDNYVQLARLEMGILRGLNITMRKTTFIGSGPLPLSSILFVRSLANVEIVNVDISKEANDLAQAICKRELCDCEISRMSFITTTSRSTLRDSDVVYVAALVGLDNASKRDILLDVKSKVKHGTTIVIRSADGMRTLLYPSVSEDLVQSIGLKVKVVLHPRNGIVNSIIVATA